MPRGLDRQDLNTGSGGSVSGGGNYLRGAKVTTPANFGNTGMSVTHKFGNTVNWTPSPAHFGNQITVKPSPTNFGNTNPKNNDAPAQK